MKSQIIGLRVGGTVFALVCLGHLLRIITQVDVLIAGREIPVWVNAVGVLIVGWSQFMDVETVSPLI